MRPFVQVALLLCLLVALSVPLHAAPPSAPADRPTSLRLSLTSEPPRLKESVRAEGTFATFDTASPLVGEPGNPALPVVSQLVGIPAATAPHVHFELGKAEALPTLAHPLEPMPTHRPIVEASAEQGYQETGLTTRYTPDETLYRQSGWYPAAPVRVSEPMSLRGQQMVRVEFFPVQVNLATGALRWFPQADVALTWEEANLAAPVATGDDPHFEETFAALLSNYEEARHWRSPRTPAPRISQGSEPVWQIVLEGKGLFRIPFADLLAAGVDLSDLSRLALFYGPKDTPQEQAIWFDNQALYLINTRDHGRWSEQIVYRLERLETGAGLRMGDLPAAPNGAADTVQDVPYDLRFEEDTTYVSRNSSTRVGERWIWRSFIVLPSIPTDTFTTTFDLPHLVPNTPAQITSEVGPEHRAFPFCYRLRAEVNGHVAERTWYDNFTPFDRTIDVPAGNISLTDNLYQVQLLICDSVSTMALNAFTVHYQRALVADANTLTFENKAAAEQNYEVSGLTSNTVLAFETSTLNTPQRLTGGTPSASAPYRFTFGRPPAPGEQYLITTLGAAQSVQAVRAYEDRGLSTDLRQTDYLIITPPDFADAMEPLRQFRASQGYSSRLVHTTDIYNDFGDGTPNPDAIRAFLLHAYRNWEAPAPAYVLLVGDATYDPFDIYETGDQVWIPPLMAYKDIYVGEVPSDNALVAALDVGDLPSDSVPDMHIGRLPANSATEAEGMVEKLIRYEESPSFLNDWRRSMLFVAQNPDAAGDFYWLSDRLALPIEQGGLGLIPQATDITRAYLRLKGTPYTTELAVRDQIVSSLDAGQLVVQYVGHASRTQWANAGGVWSVRRHGGTNDANLLIANDRLPMVLPWTCSEGYYVIPGEPSVSETMMRLPDKGVIASFAPTGLDVATGHDVMAIGFFKAMFGENPTAQTGPLTLRSKLELSTTSGYDRLYHTYMLYGDPATTLAVPACLYDESVPCEVDSNIFLPQLQRATSP